MELLLKVDKPGDETARICICLLQDLYNPAVISYENLVMAMS